MFFNISNHSSKNWSEKQIQEAIKLDSFEFDGELIKGEIKDIPFPNVSPQASWEEIVKIAKQIIDSLELVYDSAGSNTCMVMGEFSLAHCLTELLLQEGVRVVVATTERVATEENGVKSSIFRFIRFREIKPLSKGTGFDFYPDLE